MSEKCEPPEELRGVDGEHHIYRHPAGTDVQGSPITARWGARYQGWWADWVDLRGHNAVEAAAMGWLYDGPALTPAEASTLRQERDAAFSELIKWSREAGALRARVEALEGALDFYACIDHYPVLNAVAPSVVRDDYGKRARAALKGGPDGE